jgi:hypothetical protein
MYYFMSGYVALGAVLYVVGCMACVGLCARAILFKRPTVGWMPAAKMAVGAKELRRASQVLIDLDAEYAARVAVALCSDVPSEPLEWIAWTWTYWAVCRLRELPILLPNDRLTEEERGRLPRVMRDLLCLDACRVIYGDGNITERRLGHLVEMACGAHCRAADNTPVHVALLAVVQRKLVMWEVMDVQGFASGWGPLLPENGPDRELARKILGVWAAADALHPVEPPVEFMGSKRRRDKKARSAESAVVCPLPSDL